MGYIDFSYYSDIYGGKAVPKEDFTIYEIKSRMRIDRQTFNRVKNAIENVPGFQVPEEIKNAQCAIIDYMKLYDNNGGTIVASETVSKHSVTYSGVKSYDDEIKDIVKEFLGGTPWTYMGGGAGYA